MSTSLSELYEQIIEDGVIDKEEVTLLRETLYADGVIDRDEAEFLFRLNDATTENEGNDSSWDAFFVEALTDHVLQDDVSPGVLDEEEAAFLIGKIEGDGKVDERELNLLVRILEESVNEAPEFFLSFVHKSLKEAIVEDGVVDAQEVALLEKVIYGVGGAGGSDVDRTEADLLFAINDEVTQNSGHDPSWGRFFVEAIGKHVLEDEESPNEIDEEEAAYLIEKIGADGQVDENEKRLLFHLQATATSIAPSLSSLIDKISQEK